MEREKKRKYYRRNRRATQANLLRGRNPEALVASKSIRKDIQIKRFSFLMYR